MFKRIIAIMFISILAISTQVSAEIKHIDVIGTYTAGASESLDVAKMHAVEEAKKTALEQAGVYVSSYSKTHNMVLTEDQVETMASNIMKTNIKKYDVSFTPSSEILVKAYVEFSIDTGDISEKALDKRKEDNITNYMADELLYAQSNRQADVELEMEKCAKKVLYDLWKMSYHPVYNINGKQYYSSNLLNTNPDIVEIMFINEAASSSEASLRLEEWAQLVPLNTNNSLKYCLYKVLLDASGKSRLYDLKSDDIANELTKWVNRYVENTQDFAGLKIYNTPLSYDFVYNTLYTLIGFYGVKGAIEKRQENNSNLMHDKDKLYSHMDEIGEKVNKGIE